MTPKEDRQPMTTREEWVALADEMKAFLDRSTMNSMAEEFLRKVVNALRLASRQECLGQRDPSQPRKRNKATTND
jgi:hypothetical protein